MEFGLIGKSLGHSFSQHYFSEKFTQESLSHNYSNFELSSINELPELIETHPDLRGLNVTIPYKKQVIPFLNEISEEATQIGAVNTLRISRGKLEGFNTDAYGFEKSLLPLLKEHHTKALILGTGGASGAVAHVLRVLGISYKKVSRAPKYEEISYADAEKCIKDHFLIINTTPLGTFPSIEEYPPHSFRSVSENHLFYDLIYNPAETLWLKKAKTYNASIKNGLEMLQLQAEKSWQIWNEV